MPPSVFWGHGDGAWTETDRQLVRAVLLNERGTCSCGHHIDDTAASDPGNLGWFAIAETTCLACKALDDAAKQGGGTDPKQRIKTHVRDDRP